MVSFKGPGRSKHDGKLTRQENKKKTGLFQEPVFVENIGFEPMTSWLPAKRSSQLS